VAPSARGVPSSLVARSCSLSAFRSPPPANLRSLVCWQQNSRRAAPDVPHGTSACAFPSLGLVRCSPRPLAGGWKALRPSPGKQHRRLASPSAVDGHIATPALRAHACCAYPSTPVVLLEFTRFALPPSIVPV
jgi:hypothetical protein